MTVKIDEGTVFEKIEELIRNKANGWSGYLSVETDHEGEIYIAQHVSSASWDQDQEGRISQVLYGIAEYDSVDDVLLYALNATVEGEKEYNAEECVDMTDAEIAESMLDSIDLADDFRDDIRDKIDEAEAEIARVATMEAENQCVE